MADGFWSLLCITVSHCVAATVKRPLWSWKCYFQCVIKRWKSGLFFLSPPPQGMTSHSPPFSLLCMIYPVIGEAPPSLFSHLMMKELLESPKSIHGLSGLSGEPRNANSRYAELVDVLQACTRILKPLNSEWVNIPKSVLIHFFAENDRLGLLLDIPCALKKKNSWTYRTKNDFNKWNQIISYMIFRCVRSPQDLGWQFSTSLNVCFNGLVPWV